MVIFVDQCNAGGRICKSARGFKPGESCANDDDMWKIVCVHDDLISFGFDCEIIHHYYNQIGLICKD